MEKVPPEQANIEKPYILAETGDFAVVYKPPRMHCAPLKKDGGGTLLEWYANIFPPVMEILGKNPVEGGLVHRLDFDTHGLVLIAKNKTSLDSFYDQQEQGRFTKEYSALTIDESSPQKLPGFPPPPFGRDLPSPPFTIESFFRPFGPGRKSVRPVSDPLKKGKELASDFLKPYQTEVIETAGAGIKGIHFTVRIKRGFRHQIRCHLSWIGKPIVNDPLYGNGDAENTPPLSLCAQGLFFFDPGSGKPREYRLVSTYL
jgi:23S rRNA pseudouridine1911/1915/1917 synthase